MVTTVKIYEQTKKELDQFREYKNESYDEVIRKLISIANDVEDNAKLSKQTIRDIKEARKRTLNGKYVTLAQARKRLGL